MEIKEEIVLKQLSKVIDPQTGQDIVARHMISDLKINGAQVSFALSLSNFNTPHKQALNFNCQSVIADVYPGADVHVHMKQVAETTRLETNPTPQIRNIIAVGSGKGGVGKSTVAVNLALGLKQLGAKVGIMDADVYGPSIPTMLGLQGKRPGIKEVYGSPKMVPLEAYGIQAMSIGFIIDPEAAVVLRGPRLGAIIKQFFNDCLWDELDYLVIDLPPGTGDVQLSLVQTVAVTGAVIVTTPQEVAFVDAVKAVNMFTLPNINVPILGVVENMAWFTPAELPNNKYYLFGEGGGKKLAHLAETMLLGQVPLVQSTREGGDSGKPIMSQGEGAANYDVFMKIAQNVARQVAVRNEMLPPSSVAGAQ